MSTFHVVRVWRAKVGRAVSTQGVEFTRWKYSFTVNGEPVDSMISEVAGALLGAVGALAATESATEMQFEVEVIE